MAANTKLFVNPEQCRLWRPYRELHSSVTDAIINGNSLVQGDLELILRKHRTSFLQVMQTNPKTSQHRKLIDEANKEGIHIVSSSHSGTCKLDEATIAETLIISDLFNINELEALELLLAGEQQMTHYPGLTRGLVAVLLFHDGRRCLATSLRMLVQASAGRRYSTNISRDMQAFITEYTNQQMSDGLLNRILGHLSELDNKKLLEKLSEQRALGDAKHRHQVTSLIEETRQSLADTVFYWSCQKGMSRLDTLSLFNWLKDLKLKDGKLDGATLAILMAFLYSIDTTSFLEGGEETEGTTAALPILSDSTFVPSVHQAIRSHSNTLTQLWAGRSASAADPTSEFRSGLLACFQFAWSLSLRILSQCSALPEATAGVCEEDEEVVELALQQDVFKFIYDCVVKSPSFTVEEEFYIRKLHSLITDFICHMPLKTKELRDIGEDSARILLTHLQDGSEPPNSLRKDFQHFLCLIGDFYALESNEYQLAEEFWCVERPPSPKQVSLHKFLRLAGELIPPPLFVPYLKMLEGLSSSETGAIHCFNLLKTNGEHSSTVSWDHIFSSLNQYFTSLRHEVASNESERVRLASRNHMARDITEHELAGLIAVCKLITQVSTQSPQVRYAIADSQQWLAPVILFGLLGCGVSISLKSEILRALAALARSAEVASNIWQTLELSQLLVTSGVEGTAAKAAGGLLTELENVESRMETYPMLRSFLSLIDNLCLSSGQPPETLGAGYRAPGFHPYLNFIINDVVLKFSTRGYKEASEKWQVAASAFSVLHRLLSSHTVEPENFSKHLVELSTGAIVSDFQAPGHTLLTMLLQSSHLLKTLLSVISEGLQLLLQYDLTSPVRKPLEKATLLALQILNVTLDKQDDFLNFLRQANHPTIVSRLEKLLLGINSYTGQADHVVTIARYASLVNLLPNHALHAVCITGTVCRQPAIQTELLSLFMADTLVSREILSGLVEGIEQGAEWSSGEANSVRCEMASASIKFLLDTVNLPSTNISHFLLGFNVHKPLFQTDLQIPGQTGVYRTCLHAVLSLMECDHTPPALLELAYHLIYTLCSNPDTSSPTMRYLRNTQDFFIKTLCKLKFSHNEATEEELSVIIKQQTWFMKTLAIELRLTSINKQRSHTQSLINCLLDYNTTYTEGGGRGSADLSRTVLSHTSQYHSLELFHSSMKSRLLQFLDLVSFHDIGLGDIMLEHFNTTSVMQVLSSCEEQAPESGLVSINIPQVHQLLVQEINLAQQGNSMGPLAHRDVLLAEIKQILAYAVEWNTVREAVNVRLQAFDSWRQVTEVLLSGCPAECLGDKRPDIIVNILNALIRKCLQDGCLDDLISPACGVILSLMANLRQSVFKDGLRDTNIDNGLQVILKGILNLIVTSSGSLQRARANLYGALLYYLQMCESELSKDTNPLASRGVSGVLEGKQSATEKLAKEALHVIYGFGDAILEVICRDACDGLNVSRMLALSCLDSLSALDPPSCHVLRFMSSHGYIRHLLESLVQSDSILVQSLDPAQPLRHLYIYESTMSLLSRLAMTAQGASALLNSGLMMRLAECSVYDAKPNLSHGLSAADSMDCEGFNPSVSSRYRQILLPCLKLCQTVLISLGTENENAADQVMKFIVAHGDVFHSTLRGQTVETCDSLEELSLLTAVLCRAASFTAVSQSEEERELMFRGQVSRIQRRLGSLISKYLLVDDWMKMFGAQESLDESERCRMTVYMHEIAANISTYCRNVVANSTHDPSYCRVLFGPSLSEALDQGDFTSKSTSRDYWSSSSLAPPSLSLMVIQIKQASAKLLDALDDHKQLQTRLDSLSDCSEAVRGETGSDAVAIETKQEVRDRLERQTSIIQLLCLILENSLYIVWRHLDFYLTNCIPENRDTSLFRAHHSSVSSMRHLTEKSLNVSSTEQDKPKSIISSGITQEELDTLKETTPSVIDEPLLQKLAAIEQCYASKRTHFGYIGALSRRLRRLINLHCC